MKNLTILIFSGPRFGIKNLLSDIAKLDQSNMDIAVVEWAEDQKILNEKEKIYFSFKKKINNLKIYYQKGKTYQAKYEKFINNFNTKYIWNIGDDDRVNIISFAKIIKYLNFNFSGITLSSKNLNNKNEPQHKDHKYSDTIRLFDIHDDLHQIGYISTQIIKTDLIKQVFQEERKNFRISWYPHNFIILKIIKKFGNWHISNLKSIESNVGNMEKEGSIFTFANDDEKFLLRLESEYVGYLTPLANNYSNLSRGKINNIYIKLFFRNIISWLFLSLKYHGKKKTFERIKEIRNIIKEPFTVKISLFLFNIFPIFLLDFLRILRKKIINRT